ncbi:MAG: LytTR family DNA-binding domain-containing protein [Bacillota bacterium]|nr:LytTR family DNA-binding domain-containing protein [Bacillota bacterium]
MDIKIIDQIKGKVSVIIQCDQVDHEVKKLKAHIENFDNKLYGYEDGRQFVINLSQVLYFESVDNRSFLYTEDKVLEVKKRLYQLEETLPKEDFIRISKSLIVNINKISSLMPQLNRTILLKLNNGESLYISRKYVPAVKKLLSI